jgi:hypothetical protein
MRLLVLPSYFPSISQYAAMAQAQSVTLEADDNYQKQTNRNRMYIYSPNGVQLLNVPIKHSKDAHQKTRDVKIETAFDWQKLHFKSLEAAYRSSPFFEYFEDAFMPVYEKRHTFLTDLNLETMDIAAKCLGMPWHYEKTQEYFHDAQGFSDARFMANGKKDPAQLEPYRQVFAEKHGFLNNLSIVDLICNEGRHALDYLRRQTVNLP